MHLADCFSQLALIPVSQPTVLQILEGKVQHWLRMPRPRTSRPSSPGGVQPVCGVADDAAVPRRLEHAEAELVLGHVQVHRLQKGQIQLLFLSFLHLLAETPMRTSLLSPTSSSWNSQTYRDVVSHKLWDLVVCRFDDDIKGKVSRGASAVRHAQFELVCCGLHPLVAGLDVVHMAVNNVPVGEGSWQREGTITALVT